MILLLTLMRNGMHLLYRRIVGCFLKNLDKIHKLYKTIVGTYLRQWWLYIISKTDCRLLYVDNVVTVPQLMLLLNCKGE